MVTHEFVAVVTRHSVVGFSRTRVANDGPRRIEIVPLGWELRPGSTSLFAPLYDHGIRTTGRHAGEEDDLLLTIGYEVVQHAAEHRVVGITARTGYNYAGCVVANLLMLDGSWCFRMHGRTPFWKMRSQSVVLM